MLGTFKYPAEFRADAVALVRSSERPVAQIAKELGVNHETLRTWVRNYKPVDPALRTTYQPGELAQCDLWFPPAKVP